MEPENPPLKIMIAIFTHGSYNILTEPPSLKDFQRIDQVIIDGKNYDILLDDVYENFHLNYHSISLPTFLSTMTSRKVLESVHEKKGKVTKSAHTLSDRDIAYYKLRKSWIDNDPEMFASLLAEKRSNNLYNWSRSYDKRHTHIPPVNLENILVDKFGSRLMLDKTFSTEFSNYYKNDKVEDIARGIFLFVEGHPYEIPLMLTPNNPKNWTGLKCYRNLKSIFFPEINKDSVTLLSEEEQSRFKRIHNFFLLQERIAKKIGPELYYLKKTTSDILELLYNLFPLNRVDLTWVDFSCSSILGDNPEGMAIHNKRRVYPYRYNKPEVVRQIFQHLLDIPHLAFGKEKHKTKRHHKHHKQRKTKFNGK